MNIRSDQMNTTLPRVKNEGFFEQKRNSSIKAQRGWRGFHSLIYLVFGDLKQCLTLLAGFYSKAYNQWFRVFCFHHSHFDFCFKQEFDIDKQENKWVNTDGLIRNKHIPCIIIIIIQKQTSLHASSIQETKKTKNDNAKMI